MHNNQTLVPVVSRSILMLLVLSLTQAGGAERRRKTRPGEEWATTGDQMFGPWFGESDAERLALEDFEIDLREERRIGEAMVDEFLTSLKRQGVRVTRRGTGVAYVQSLLSQIRRRMQHAERYREIRVYVANSPDTDARAFPGGSIVVMTGLIEFAESEAALVGVLGHELSHIDHGHQLRTARAAKLAQHGWDFRNGSPQDMQRQIMVMSKNFARPFNAEDEAIADRDGATWAFELGYDPPQLAEVFRRFEQRRPRAQSQMPSFLRTHPYHAERYDDLRESAVQLLADQPRTALYVGRKNLAKRISRQTREFAE